ncbi:hypothetical protein AB0L70_07685 [Kribbella sp. NPDC051952]|uniref:hypothetical protein n=1 Tax=Kribbella sp. NPDC051952 TaxID=3154851 RepID=UPI00342CAD39
MQEQLQQQQLQQQQLDVGATFTTTRTRPAVLAGITTFFFLWMVATDNFAYGDTWTAERTAELFVNLIELLLLLAAVRPWILVLRRPTELRLTPAALAIRRGGRELSIPWGLVNEIRMGGGHRRPWVVAQVDPSVAGIQLLGSRRRDGSHRIFPIAHGRSVKKRNAQIVAVRGAIMEFGRRWIEHDL